MCVCVSFLQCGIYRRPQMGTAHTSLLPIYPNCGLICVLRSPVFHLPRPKLIQVVPARNGHVFVHASDAHNRNPWGLGRISLHGPYVSYANMGTDAHPTAPVQQLVPLPCFGKPHCPPNIGGAETHRSCLPVPRWTLYPIRSAKIRRL